MRNLLAMIAAFLLIGIQSPASADHYRAGDLEKLYATPNWELVRQDIDIETGEDYGAPVLVQRYSTLAACDAHQRGRVSRPHNVGVKWVVGVFVCRHKDADVI